MHCDKGVTALPTDAPLPRPPTTGEPMPGPGTELKAIFVELGLVDSKRCNCEAHASQMNLWGVRGCRAFFDVIVGWLREDQGKFGWVEKLTARARAVTTGIAFKVNWSDPFPGLVELAITRAEDAAKDKGKVDALPV